MTTIKARTRAKTELEYSIEERNGGQIIVSQTVGTAQVGVILSKKQKEELARLLASFVLKGKMVRK